MKWILCCLIFFSTTNYAQTKGKLLTDKLKRTEQIMLGKTPQTRPQESVFRNNKSLTKSLPFNNVENRPVGKMPCVRPNMKRFQNMPNGLDSSILINPIDPGIYVKVYSPRSTGENEIDSGH